MPIDKEDCRCYYHKKIISTQCGWVLPIRSSVHPRGKLTCSALSGKGIL